MELSCDDVAACISIAQDRRDQASNDEDDYLCISKAHPVAILMIRLGISIRSFA
jgi:hypothetical protein